MKYPPEYIDRLELLWGEGFMSPGGPQEVKEILKGIDVSGKSILDIGCGTGGVEVVLVRELGARRVVGIDVEPELVSRSNQRVAAANISEQVEILLVEEGPLTFSDRSFDVVFSKDSIAHIPDKTSLMNEIFRVLQPRGWFTASDWMAAEETANSPAWRRLSEVIGTEIVVSTAVEMENLLDDAGFVQITTADRKPWYAPIAAEEVERLEGPLRKRICEIVDEKTYLDWLELRRALRDAATDGVLGPVHVRGFKPE